jgi:hypothetical protein
MSNSVALSVLCAISFASVVGSMKVNIAVVPITGVRVHVDFVEMILDNAVYHTKRTYTSLAVMCMIRSTGVRSLENGKRF